MDVRVEEIDPSIAGKYLKKNKKNRKIKGSVVQKISAQMKRGAWKENGEAIVFGKSGHLIDGQHRLSGVVDSGKSFKFVVVRNVPDAAQETIDQGGAGPRKLRDVLEMNNETDAKTLAAAANLYHGYTVYHRVRNAGTPDKTLTLKEMVAFINRNNQLRESVAFIKSLGKTKLMPASYLVALHTIFCKINKSEADFFMERLVAGTNLIEGDLVKLLRDRLFEAITTNADSRRMAVPERAIAVIRVWNAERKNETLSRITVREKGKKGLRAIKAI